MSGGAFDYVQYHIGNIADYIEDIIRKNKVEKSREDLERWDYDENGKVYEDSRYYYYYDEETIERFKEAVKALRKASEIAKSFVSKRIENSASKIFTLRIESACKQMAQWKDKQVKQLFIEKTKFLSPSAAQDSVRRCTIEEIYRELFNEEMPNSNPYIK